MEIDFCRPRVIHGLFLNLNFCFEIFLRGEYKSKIINTNLRIEPGQKTDKGLIYISTIWFS